MIRIILFVFVAALLFATVETSQGAGMAPQVITKVRKSCVEILVERQLRGGGAIVESANGKTYVITAAHLFHVPNAFITVMTEDMGRYNANLVAYDFGHDLALLELVTDRQLPTIGIAKYTPSPTQPVYNFGPALRRRTLVISGEIADSRINYTDFEPSNGYLEHIFISAINPVLTSGGIWVNQEGEIIGVQSGRLKGDAGAPSSGLSMACPPNAIRNIVAKKRSASTPGIGAWVWELWTVDPSILSQVPENIDGLVVRWLREDGPLAKAGVKVNEVITSCNGKKILRRHEMFEIIRAKPTGTTFECLVFSPVTKRIRTVKFQTAPLEARWYAYQQKLRDEIR